MDFLAVVVLVLIGSNLAKNLSISIINQHYKAEIKMPLLKNFFSLLFFQLLPFSICFFRKHFRKNKNLLIKIILSEVLAIVSLIVLLVGLVNFYNQNFINSSNVLTFLFYLFFAFSLVFFLIYLSIYDIFLYKIPSRTLRQLSILILLVEIFTGFFIFIYGDWPIALLPLGQISNLGGFVFLLFLAILIRFMSKGSGFGEGDVEVLSALGLALGLKLSIVFIFITLIAGGLISIFYAIVRKQIKGLIVPFVPFILLGLVLTLGFGQEIFDLVFPSMYS